MFCGKCGIELANEVKFCSNCGEKILSEEINLETKKKKFERKGMFFFLLLIITLLSITFTLTRSPGSSGKKVLGLTMGMSYSDAWNKSKELGYDRTKVNIRPAKTGSSKAIILSDSPLLSKFTNKPTALRLYFYKKKLSFIHVEYRGFCNYRDNRILEEALQIDIYKLLGKGSELHRDSDNRRCVRNIKGGVAAVVYEGGDFCSDADIYDIKLWEAYLAEKDD